MRVSSLSNSLNSLEGNHQNLRGHVTNWSCLRSAWTKSTLPQPTWDSKLSRQLTPQILVVPEVTLPGSPDHAFPLLATPTELQRRAFDLLEIDPARDVAM